MSADAITHIPTHLRTVRGSDEPVVFVQNGHVFANSRDVAACFQKQHGHVLRDIDNLITAEPSLGLSNFGEGSYTLAETGPQQHRCYDMDRDGFALLAMGFSGSKALRWKVSYIRAFNAMEAQLRQPIAIETNNANADLLNKVLANGGRGIAPQVFTTDAIGRASGGRLTTNRLAAAARSLGWMPNGVMKWNGATRRVYLSPTIKWPRDAARRRATIRRMLDGSVAQPQTVHTVDQIDPAMDMLLLCEAVLLANEPIARETATALGSTIEQALKLLAPVREAANV